MLDAPAEVMAIALNYLGLDPNSEKPDDLKKAEDLMTAIKPYIRKFDSSGYIDDLANGDACLSLGYSGDVYIAKDRAERGQARASTSQYVIPKEGTIEWFDMLAIPADAPHPENALKFINYIMEPKVTADISNDVFYANGNKAAFAADRPRRSPAIPNIYPPADVAGQARRRCKAHSQDFTATADAHLDTHQDRPVTHSRAGLRPRPSFRGRRPHGQETPDRRRHPALARPERQAVRAHPQRHQEVRRRRRGQRRLARHLQGRAVLPARRLGLGQVDAAAHARRLRGADRRHRSRSTGRTWPACRPTSGRST